LYSLPSPSSSSDGSEYKIAHTAASFILLVILFAAVAFGFYSVQGGKSHLLVRLAPDLGVAVSVAALFFFRPAARMFGASIFIGLGMSAYCIEALSGALVDPDRPALQAMETTAKKAGIAYDGRTRLEVLADLHRKGVIAWPPFYPYLLLNSPLKVGGEDVLPLGSLANARTVCCNEGGHYLNYTTDEHGFRNPPGSWSNIPADAAIVGASSAVSECVEESDTLLSLLRARYPRTVTIGAGGNGPLLELASIREYLPAVKPKIVLWLFGEVHTPEYLEGEEHNKFLLRYLDPAFRQGLFSKQQEIDRAVAQYFDQGIQAEEVRRSLPHRTRDFAGLKDTRMLMYDFVNARSSEHKQQSAFDAGLYERALVEGARTVGQWGGTVVVVYWPDSSRYPGGPGYSPENVHQLDAMRGQILGIAGKNGIPSIDLSHSFPEEQAAAAGNARFFYPFPAHFKPAGYHIAARELMNAMAKLEFRAK
jgi:hypothetical protein